MYSDGFPDQFGGPKEKKYMNKRFKQFLEKNRKIITYVLYLFSFVLVYLIYNAIDSPIEFNKIKNENKINIPLLLKISPDIVDNHISEIADVAIKNDISGIILTNTTNSNRDKLMNNFKKEEGGLSGKPLQQISTDMIKKFYKQLNGKIPIIGVGGVNSGKSAYEKITAGASLLQLYTGLVYKGPLLVKNIKKELIQILKSEGLNNIKDAVGKGL